MNVCYFSFVVLQLIPLGKSESHNMTAIALDSGSNTVKTEIAGDDVPLRPVDGRPKKEIGYHKDFDKINGNNTFVVDDPEMIIQQNMTKQGNITYNTTKHQLAETEESKMKDDQPRGCKNVDCATECQVRFYGRQGKGHCIDEECRCLPL